MSKAKSTCKINFDQGTQTYICQNDATKTVNNKNCAYIENLSNSANIIDYKLEKDNKVYSDSKSINITDNASTQTPFEEIFVTTSLDRNSIVIDLNGKRCQALVDSGASVSCIEKSLFNKYKDVVLKPSTLVGIIGVGGERHSVLGQAKFTLNFSDLKVEHTFIVLEKLHNSSQVIIGLDFMKSNHVKIDFQRKLFTVGKVVSVNLVCDSKYGQVKCVKPEIIPAESEVVLPVRLTNCNVKGTVLLEPSNWLPSKMLMGAKCLVKVKKNKCVMRLTNPTKDDIKLSPKRVIAYVNLVNSQQIYGFKNNKENNATPLNDVHTASVFNAEISANPVSPDNSALHFEINNENLSNVEKQKLQNFLAKNRDIFSTSLANIGKTDLFKHKIETIPDAKPVHSNFYRQDPIKKAETERQVNNFLQSNICKPSDSVWNSPVVLVKKSDGSWRFAVNYRKLNKITIPISHPLPRVKDVFDALGETKPTIFSTLDLNSAYFQMELDPETRHKASFITHEGVYEWVRMPFGLRNAPMSFQMLMSKILKGLHWKFVLCYINDILCFSSDFETHLVHLDQVFQRLREANLTLKPSKCHFGVNKVTFLGHILSENGVEVDPAKTEKIETFPIPKSQRELRGFLGLCNYYRKFVKGYSKISAPLNSLLKKTIGKTFSKTDWTDNCQKAFKTLKNALVTMPILKFPNINKPFILSTDASGTALGYVLGQKDESGKEFVVSYGGRALQPDEKK